MRSRLQQKIDNKTKPLGALGRLETIALEVGVIQNTLSPSIQKPTILVFAADHGLAEENISPYPKDVTWQMAMNFVAGGAAISVFCRHNGIALKVIDAGVDYDFPPDCPIIPAKIARGSRNMRREPAMSLGQCEEAMTRGRGFVRREAENGCNTIGFGEMGIGNTSASSLLMHRFTGLPIETCTGAGTGMQGEQLEYKKRVLKEISGKYDPATPLDTLATFGGLEIAMMTGAFLEARSRGIGYPDRRLHLHRQPAHRLASSIPRRPETRSSATFPTNRARRPARAFPGAARAAARHAGGEGTGAAVALPVIQSAVAFLNEMASFEEAGVSNK